MSPARSAVGPLAAGGSGRIGCSGDGIDGAGGDGDLIGGPGVEGDGIGAAIDKAHAHRGRGGSRASARGAGVELVGHVEIARIVARQASDGIEAGRPARASVARACGWGGGVPRDQDGDVGIVGQFHNLTWRGDHR